MTVLRPKRSERPPSTGEKTNCISAQVVPNNPNTLAALAVSPPRKLSTSFGSTGITMPRASTSMTTVTKMKATAAGRPTPGAEGAAVGSTVASRSSAISDRLHRELEHDDQIHGHGDRLPVLHGRLVPIGGRRIQGGVVENRGGCDDPRM